ncbi:hypothetical protein KOI35_33335 [Actinoplanes bogorensis]|uniref:Secreted protein n=1 Tax=Paractinoplanes bogorensis TaxID=1610840 RepID=A0ABS5YYD8_9ACTN|nr:hypothetical protein [Actinoplanes bogorensis]MBU2668408.1 hypothetical protein [Actinoplanes bogorensis]
MRLTRLAVATAAAVAAALIAVPSAAQAASTQVWFHPGDQFMPSMIWKFNSGGSGWKTSYIPSLTGWPVQRQTGFSYVQSGATFNLTTYPYLGSQRIVGLRYSSATDVWVVSNNGFTETWLGCRSAGRPAYAQVAC